MVFRQKLFRSLRRLDGQMNHNMLWEENYWRGRCPNLELPDARTADLRKFHRYVR
jgi:hypothetical protein